MKKFVHTFYLAVISILAIGVWQLYTSYHELSAYSSQQAAQVMLLRQQVQEAEQARAWQPEPSSASLTPISEPSNASLTPNSELEERIAWLEGEVEALEWQLQNRSQIERQQGALSPEETAAFREAIRAAAQGIMRSDDIAVRSEEEPVDPNWAYPVEQTLQDFFVSREEFRDFSLSEIDCRTSYCQLTVAATQPGQNFPTELLHRHLMEQEWYGTGTIMSFTNPETGESTVILQAKGNTPP